MAVKPPPKIGNNINKSQIDSFINKGGKVEEEKPELIVTTLRLPKTLIDRIDRHCKERYQSRTAFILQSILAILDKEG